MKSVDNIGPKKAHILAHFQHKSSQRELVNRNSSSKAKTGIQKLMEERAKRREERKSNEFINHIIKLDLVIMENIYHPSATCVIFFKFYD